MNKHLSMLLPLLLLVPGVTIAEPVIEVITVNNRPASEIQPLLLPFLEEYEQLVANGDSLIVKASPERLQAIANLVRKLDNPLTNLQITVMQSRDVSADQLNAGFGVGINVPLDNPGNPNARVDGHYEQSQGHRGTQNSQTVRTLEGVPAQIKVGNVVPITSYQTYHDGYGYPYQDHSTQLVEATTGFTVTPRLVGQQVMLEVSPWSDRFDAYGQIQTQQANTSIRADLGEWVEIGGVDESGQNNGTGVFTYHRGSSSRPKARCTSW